MAAIRVRPVQLSFVSGAPATRAPERSCASFYDIGGTVHWLDLPEPTSEVVPGVPWGRPEEIFTPAYWRTQVWFIEKEQAAPFHFRLGDSLREEVAACLLGGYGIPSEVGLAAFRAVKEAGLLEDNARAAQHEFVEVLRTPMSLGGRCVRYRFAAQRSQYLALSLRALADLDTQCNPTRSLRDRLCGLPGVGYKTASWIVRNRFAADDVAILDVHVNRACWLIGLFESKDLRSQQYLAMEESFLRFAAGLSVRPSLLDSVIWFQMRQAASWARTLVPFNLKRKRRAAKS